MVYQSYDEYIRSILGYPTSGTNMCNYDVNPMMENSISYDTNYSNQYRQNAELEDCYPEIYKVVYPMVQKACQMNTRPVTRELVENMTDEIYMAIEANDGVQININLGNNVQSNRSIQQEAKENQHKIETKVSEKNNEEVQNRETRQINRGLRDIIRILILRELLGRPGFPGHRPPRPPMRPPFPGRPGGGRPPIMPRGEFYDFYADIYEQ